MKGAKYIIGLVVALLIGCIVFTKCAEHHRFSCMREWCKQNRHKINTIAEITHPKHWLNSEYSVSFEDSQEMVTFEFEFITQKLTMRKW